MAKDFKGGSSSTLRRKGILLPLLHGWRNRALEKGGEGVEGFASVADQVIESFPVIGILAIVIRNHILELPRGLQLAVGTGGANLYVFQVCGRQFSFLTAGAAQEFAAHDIGEEFLKRHVAFGRL